MLKRLWSVVAAPLVVVALAVPAFAEEPAIGISLGGGWVGNPTTATGALNTNGQYNSGIYLRGQPFGQYFEGSVGLLSRAQALGLGNAEVFETTGLALAAGFKYQYIHLGIDGEVSLLHQILPVAGSPGMLTFHEGAGVVIEPYLGVTLPFLKSAFTSLDLSVHYPILTVLDPSIGPRVVFTLWVTTPPKTKTDKTDADDSDDDSDDVGTPTSGGPNKVPPKAPKKITKP